MSTYPSPSSTAASTDSTGFPPPATIKPGPDSAREDEPWPAPASEFRTLYGHIPDFVDPLDPEHPDTSFTQTRRLRHDGWSPERMRLFHERLAECGVVLEACEAAGMGARGACPRREAEGPNGSSQLSQLAPTPRPPPRFGVTLV
ncbi:MAG: hypothetical protein H7X93_08740 [Sphingomonadaceae bacterium]|nr:hypothetical protein [Sphingomonadaceae bacterium]